MSTPNLTIGVNHSTPVTTGADFQLPNLTQQGQCMKRSNQTMFTTLTKGTAGNKSIVIYAVATTALLCAPAAWAGGQSTLPGGAAFSSGCAGLNPAYTGHAGDALTPVTGNNCQTVMGAVGQPIELFVSNSGTNRGHLFNNSAHSTVEPKSITLQASNGGSEAQAFPTGIVDGGWNEKFILTGGGATGTQAVWIIPIHVSGTMTANGRGALGRFNVEAYRYHAAIVPYGNAINAAAYAQYQALNPGDCFIGVCLAGHNGSVLSSWDYETVYWQASDYAGPPGDHATITSINVDRDIYFAVAFTWGTAFDLGVYAAAIAGELNIGGSSGDNVTAIDFGIHWNGPGYVLNWNGTSLDPAHITAFNIDSSGGSGANYN